MNFPKTGDIPKREWSKWPKFSVPAYLRFWRIANWISKQTDEFQYYADSKGNMSGAIITFYIKDPNLYTMALLKFGDMIEQARKDQEENIRHHTKAPKI